MHDDVWARAEWSQQRIRDLEKAVPSACPKCGRGVKCTSLQVPAHWQCRTCHHKFVRETVDLDFREGVRRVRA